MQTVTVSTQINAPIETVWKVWNTPEDIMNWCHASDDWHAPFSENDLTVGGKFQTTMAARDGSVSFDFEGVYTNISEPTYLEYVIGDGRQVSVQFEEIGTDGTQVTETFDIEDIHSVDQQRAGWQSILDNFKNYTENS